MYTLKNRHPVDMYKSFWEVFKDGKVAICFSSYDSLRDCLKEIESIFPDLRWVSGNKPSDYTPKFRESTAISVYGKALTWDTKENLKELRYNIVEY